MVSRLLRSGSAGSLALVLLLAGPGNAQIPEVGDLPQADAGAVGELLDPVEDLIEALTQPIDDALVDVPFDNAVRLTADDAVGAAIALSQATFLEGTQRVLLARDDLFADSLSSVAAQGLAGAPLLLTPTGQLDGRVAEEIERLGASSVLVLGNELAISEQVYAALQERGLSVDRAGGPTRIETAVEIARRLSPTADTAILMRAYPSQGADDSQVWADALAVGPLGSLMDYPLLLTTTGTLHQATARYFEDAGVQRVIIVGGERAVDDAVAATLEASGRVVERVAGANRYATAIAIARHMGYQTAADPSRLILSEAADSDDPLWAAGFAAAAHAAVYEAPVLLSEGAIPPAETLEFVAAGLAENALRVGNEPLLCNSFTHLLACEAIALLMLGTLDEVDHMLDGALSDALGPLGLEELAAMLQEVLPGSDGQSPQLLALLSQLLGGGEQEEPAFLASQQEPVSGALDRLLLDDEGRARPGTEQALLIEVVAAVSTLLDGQSLDSENPQQAEAAALLFDGIDTLVGSDELPLDGSDALLTAVAELVAQVAGALDLADVAALVELLGTDLAEGPAEVVEDVSDVLVEGADPELLVRAYGADAEPLAATLRELQGRG